MSVETYTIHDAIQMLPGYDPHIGSDDFFFDEDKAIHAIDFFHRVLRHSKAVIGQPHFILEPFQVGIVANLFGWYMKKSPEIRRYNNLFLYVPRKNGKSPLCAGIVLYIMSNDKMPEQDNFSAAADTDQAKIIFDYAKGMIELAPELSDRFTVWRSRKTIEHKSKNHVYRVLSSVSETKHGLNGYVIIIDEVHAHKTRDLCDVLETSVAARPGYLIINVTTADFEGPSICNEKLHYAQSVRDRVIDNPRFLPVIYEGENDLWEDEDHWYEVNPNLGVSIDEDYFREEFEKAKHIPSKEYTFKRLHLNIKTGTAEKFIDISNWKPCHKHFQLEELKRVKCYGGLDIGSVGDLMAFCLCWPFRSKYYFHWWYWCPKMRAHDRQNRDNINYIDWAKAGYIKLTEGNAADYFQVRKDILAINAEFQVVQTGVDRLFQGAELMQGLERGGMNVVEFGQGFVSMAVPVRDFEEIIIDQNLVHGGDPVTQWMMFNCVTQEDAAGNKKLDKKKSPDKIDGAVAAVMALGIARLPKEEKFQSVYAKRGLQSIVVKPKN